MGKSSDAFKDFVLDQLARVPALSSAPFFGGIGLRSGTSFFGMIMDGTLYFSTGPATRAEYEKRGSKCFSYAKQGKVQKTKLFEVPADVLDDADTLRIWADRAIADAGQKRKAAGVRKSGRPGPRRVNPR
jgi:TfoX/Sxy family transcriptional regulator of competence genes